MAQIPSKPGFPDDKMALTHILVVFDLTSSVTWYRDILGARFHSWYGRTSAVFEFNGSWILLVTGGGPTADKPDVSFAAPVANSPVDHSFTIRVGDRQQAYLDGHLFEISQV